MNGQALTFARNNHDLADSFPLLKESRHAARDVDGLETDNRGGLIKSHTLSLSSGAGTADDRRRRGAGCGERRLMA